MEQLMSFSTKLIDLIKTDPRFVDDDGELVLAEVQDCAWQISSCCSTMQMIKLNFLRKLRNNRFLISILILITSIKNFSG
jgi:hypothetical protein